MSNVLVEKNKLDVLANAISNKSGEPLKLTLDEMVEAVDGIDTGGITPTGNINITQAGVTDVTNYATATVPEAEVVDYGLDERYVTVSGIRRYEYRPKLDITGGYISTGWKYYDEYDRKFAVPSGTTITPSESSQTIGGANYMMEGAVTVNAIPSTYVGSGVTRCSSSDVEMLDGSVLVGRGYYSGDIIKNMPSGSATPASSISATGATVSTGTNTLTLSKSVSNTPQVTAGYISSGTAGNSSVSLTASVNTRSSSDLTVSGATVTAPSGYYSASASKSVASGTAGTPTATKGTVSNHSVSVTPSVTNTSGFISGGTKNGTAVTVSASELVSGSETKTENGTYDVTNLAEIVVDVQGGGGSTINVGKTTKTLATASNSIQFTGLSGNPTSFVVTSSADLSSGVTSVVFDGSSLHGQVFSTQATADTGFTKSYSSGTLTVTSSNSTFGANEYKLAYTYGGSASDIQTADVRVGSGATSITFPTSGRPIYWSCIFKSDFSTSQGYQRVIGVANDGTNTYGISLDSTAHASTTYWTANYSGGNLVISSQSTNAGGYFHQPGYYQLTYIVDESAPSYQTKTVTPTTSQQVVTPDTGYDALSQVTVNAIPNTYVQPTSTVGATIYRASTSNQTIAAGTYHSAAATIAAVSQTNLTADNIKSGTTISISNGQSNIWSVTGTYTGDGGGGGSSTCDTKTITNSNDQATSIQFTGLSGEPKWFFVRCAAQMSRSSSYSYYYITAVRYNGTNHYGNYWRRSNGTFYNDTTHYSHTYSNGTLTVSSSASRGAAGGSFYSGSYELVYIY